jgi:hypothetical protein
MAEEKASLEKFSLEKYLGDWSLHRNSVVVEGIIQEDGDYYVIDRNPGNSSTLIRVLKAHVIGEPMKTRTFTAAGKEVHLRKVYIKKSMPLILETFLMSDELQNS